MAVSGAVALGWIWWMRPRGPEAEETSEVPVAPPGRPVGEAVCLLQERRFPEARQRLRQLLKSYPQEGVLDLLMGRCLRGMNYFESSIPFWRRALERLPEAREECVLNLGVALHRMGRASEAYPFLDRVLRSPSLEEGRRLALAECCLELGRYEESLKILEGAPAGGGVSWIRHRGWSYMGRPEEARREVESLPDSERLMKAILEVSWFRESGDFEMADRSLRAALDRVERGTSDWARLKRSEIALRIESGEVGALERVAEELQGVEESQASGVALWGRALARLLTGRKEEGKAAAEEFLARTDPEFTPLRMERFMMLHLAGRIGDRVLEEEIDRLSRTWQNDLLYYLALARGGDRDLAERALRATPAHNFPYHAIRRLLQ